MQIARTPNITPTSAAAAAPATRPDWTGVELAHFGYDRYVNGTLVGGPERLGNPDGYASLKDAIAAASERTAGSINRGAAVLEDNRRFFVQPVRYGDDHMGNWFNGAPAFEDTSFFGFHGGLFSAAPSLKALVDGRSVDRITPKVINHDPRFPDA